ncbi:hypothetical protein [Tamlana sp. I1]|uniref:hypothetical protein n=1 Tax=Tamlana sp. I1 TaxID=2762061 RepID=UPI001890564C|nr:hypothetical protein [Tamlana sp. I1]
MNFELFVNPIEEGLKKGEQGKPKESEGSKEGEGEKEGENGKSGEKGKKGKYGKPGESGNPGEGEGNSEDQEGLLFEIYKEQQQLRQALEDRLAKEGKSGAAGSLVRQMEAVEMELLNKGFTTATLQKMMQLKHQLLKMENATFQQGEEEKRESESNTKSYFNSSNNQIPQAKQYFKTTEILNRQALPLQQVYKARVKEYFKENND